MGTDEARSPVGRRFAASQLLTFSADSQDLCCAILLRRSRNESLGKRRRKLRSGCRTPTLEVFRADCKVCCCQSINMPFYSTMLPAPS
ncbi:hypothetical protein TcWFU_002238 [Taenia crassiceps]|uniref:Uncharacterized protein n=1 Tax=Taenia crassiceps TaxID=6207 RepID=A0ABR4Q063_9CEST